FVLGQPVVLASGTETAEQLRALPGELRQQETPAAAGDVDVLAADPVEDGRVRLADVELGAHLLEGLLGDALDLDDDGPVVHLETDGVASGRPAADVCQPLHHERAVAEVRQPRRGAQPAGARADHDGIEVDVRAGHVLAFQPTGLTPGTEPSISVISLQRCATWSMVGVSPKVTPLDWNSCTRCTWPPPATTTVPVSVHSSVRR